MATRLSKLHNLFFHLAKNISHHHSAFSISVANTYADTSARRHQLIRNVTFCFLAITCYNHLHRIWSIKFLIHKVDSTYSNKHVMSSNITKVDGNMNHCNMCNAFAATAVLPTSIITFLELPHPQKYNSFRIYMKYDNIHNISGHVTWLMYY